jgi:CRP-like cAMP-binding protein
MAMSTHSENRPRVHSPAGFGFSNKLLLTLPPVDHERIARHLSIVPLKVKQVLYKQGEIIRDVYFPGGGACSVTKTMEDGSTAEIATVGNEGMLGTSVFFGDDQAQGDVFVQIAGEGGYRMPVAAFIEEMELRGAFYNRVIRYNQALMIQVMQTTVCNSLHSAEQRCCRWLLMSHDRVGTTELRLTHEFMSMMLGVRRPTVTLIVGELQKAGLVETRRGTINILDRKGLEQSSCECYESVKASFQRLMPELPGVPG